jgi:tryptophan synthase beta chain
MLHMYTLGHDFVPPGIHAGGLRYHGDSALVSQLYNEGILEAIAVNQIATFEAGVLFAKSEGIIPAPESNHAIRACIDEALRCKATGEAKCLFFNLSGHGHFDMSSYDRYFRGELEDYDYPQEAIEEALHHLPKVASRT